MTRGNIVIKWYKNIWNFEIGSDAYPENIVPLLFTLLKKNPYQLYLNDLSELFGNAALGHVGNWSYWYEINLSAHTINVWESKVRWVNAPANWKEQGWYCWLGVNGKYGYIDWVKGKKIDLTPYVFEDKL